MNADTYSPDTIDDREMWLPYINSMKVAIAHFDEEGLEETYQEALSRHPVDEVTTKLLRPLLIELGKRWNSVETGIAEEHFFAFYIRNILGTHFQSRPHRYDEAPILLAGLPGEYHEIALLLFALAAEIDGLPVLVLGTNIPLPQVAAAAERREIRAIVLSNVIEASPALLKKELAELVRRSRVPVFVGGSGSEVSEGAISRVGARPIGSDFQNALRQLRKVLDRA